MRPQPTAYTKAEGGMWLPWKRRASNLVHAIRFSDGSELDCINGWRPHTTPEEGGPTTWPNILNLWDQETKTTHQLHGKQTAVDYALKRLSAAPLPGPTAPTSTPSGAPSSASDTPTASTSSAPPAVILSEALSRLLHLPPWCKWSLSVDFERSNTTSFKMTSVPAAPSPQPNPETSSPEQHLAR
jgi:hypothetical protein